MVDLRSDLLRWASDKGFIDTDDVIGELNNLAL
jgi:hypothetical protein